MFGKSQFRHIHFNPRSSCEERHDDPIVDLINRFYFNPRSSCEERPGAVDGLADARYFTPRSSCEERPEAWGAERIRLIFQSTLLMRGATMWIYCKSSIAYRFQSTLLMRGATGHSPSWPSSSKYFNPRSSCEERRRICDGG